MGCSNHKSVQEKDNNNQNIIANQKENKDEDNLEKENDVQEQKLKVQQLKKKEIKEFEKKEEKVMKEKDSQRQKQENLEQEKKEQGRIEKERIKQERIEQERLEQEIQEQERRERGRLEQERLEKERLEQEKKEQERIEKERIEKERLEQERIEQERLEQERIEQERIEQERQEQERQEQERLEQERLEQEKDDNSNIDEQSGNKIKSVDSTLPDDQGHYLDISVNRKKNSIFIPNQEDLERFRRDGLKRNNYYRKFHQVGPLKLNKVLCDYSQNWAEHCAKKRQLDNSPWEERNKILGGRTGENLYSVGWTTQKNYTLNGTKAIDFWYEQINNYDFQKSKSKNGKIVGNFIQLVWKESTQLGIGIASTGKAIYIVANYALGGNILNLYSTNVFPLKMDEKMKEQKKKELEKEEQEKREKERIEQEQEEQERKEQEEKDQKKMELEKIEQEKNELDLKEILNDEKTGKKLKSHNNKIPADTGNYLGIILKTQKNNIFVPTQEDLERFRRDGLKRHNYYRKYHQVGPLILTKKLNDYAQYYAEKLAKQDKAEHSEYSALEQIYNDWTGSGENIHCYWTSKSNYAMTGADGVDSWYDESKDYNYSKGWSKNGRMIGHFTQLVWKGTTKLGIGVAKSSGGSFYVVANYHIGGNFEGNFTKNVLPVKVRK